MKTKKNFLKITLGVFLLTSAITFANNNNPLKNRNPLELNKEYVSNVHENSTQSDSKFLSGIISEWDVRESDKFDARKDYFNVVFKSNKGSANVIYNYEGRIISVNKNLKNVVVPNEMLQHVSEKYKGWEIVKNKYKETYRSGDDVEKTYVFTLQNGKEKKRIRMNG